MNTVAKILVAIAMVVVGALLNVYLAPELANTPLRGFFVGQIVVVPVCFLILSWKDKKRKYTPMKRLAIVAVTLSIYCIIANFRMWDQVIGHLVPLLCGALAIYLMLVFKPGVKA